jgi:hypothetical protein
MDDPIREALDDYAERHQMHAALHAVLDRLELNPGDGMIGKAGIRRVIAEKLGVTDG